MRRHQEARDDDAQPNTEGDSSLHPLPHERSEVAGGVGVGGEAGLLPRRYTHAQRNGRRMLV